MLSRDENELLTQTDSGTPAGQYFRRFWLPALLPSEVPTPDCPPVRVRLLGEDLVAFRDTNGQVGLLEEACAHRRASLFWGRNEECGLRCVYHGWKFDVNGICVDMPNECALWRIPLASTGGWSGSIWVLQNTSPNCPSWSGRAFRRITATFPNVCKNQITCKRSRAGLTPAIPIFFTPAWMRSA